MARSRRWRARFVVDASGRDTLLANQLAIKRSNQGHNSSALYGHFRGAKRAAGQARRQHHHLLVRARLVLVHPAGRRHHQRRRGVLAVLPEGAQQAAAANTSSTRSRCARRSPRGWPMRELVAEPTATGNYSYAMRHAASGERYLMVGDAYAFIDPVFSSGVMPGDAQRASTAPTWSTRGFARTRRRRRTRARASTT